MKTFRIVTSISMVFNLTAAILALISFAFVGFYPAIIGLCVMAAIPVTSRIYAKSRKGSTDRKTHFMLVFINLFSMLIVLWMSFVNLIDNVIPKL